MLQVVGISVATLICYVVLRERAPQFALVISIVGVCIVLGIGIIQLKTISIELNEIVSNIPNTASYVKFMIKALLIIIITQISSNLCRDNGLSALSTIIEITAKIVVITMILPLFRTILTLIIRLIK